MIARGNFLTTITFLVAFAVLTWSCSSSSSTTKDETAPKQSGGTAAAILAATLVVVLAVVLLSSGGEPAPEKKEPTTPLREDVPPVRNTSIKIIINVTFNYPTKGPGDEARRSFIDAALTRFNERGTSDGNTFSFPDGEATNLTLNYAINNEGQAGNDRFAGSVEMSGWGWGHIATFTSGQYPYSDWQKFLTTLTDQVYSYLHTGWHDSRKDQEPRE